MKANNVESFVTQWITGELDKQKSCRTTDTNYFHISDDGLSLLYTGRFATWRKSSDDIGTEVLAIRIGKRKKDILGNASKLKYCESHLRSAVSSPQNILMDNMIPMIPFNVFSEAKIDISKAKVIDSSGSESIYVRRFVRGVQTGDSSISFKPSPDKRKVYVHNELNNRYYLKRDLEHRHFVGAILLDIEGKKYMMDIDRQELLYYRMNPFIVKVDDSVSSVKEAYVSLKPHEVVKAEHDGVEVIRQGEWFFIRAEFITDTTWESQVPKKYRPYIQSPSRELYGFGAGGYTDYLDEEHAKNVMPKFRDDYLVRVKELSKACAMYSKYRDHIVENYIRTDIFPRSGALQAGKSRPNGVGKLMKMGTNVYVKGKVSHSGGEHETIYLTSWYRAIPNTAIESFTVQGEID